MTLSGERPLGAQNLFGFEGFKGGRERERRYRQGERMCIMQCGLVVTLREDFLKKNFVEI